jgi:hypothetical protein
MFDSLVPGVCNAVVPAGFPVCDPIFVRPDDIASAVGGKTVDDDQFPERVMLPEHASDASLKGAGAVFYGHDDADPGALGMKAAFTKHFHIPATTLSAHG